MNAAAPSCRARMNWTELPGAVQHVRNRAAIPPDPEETGGLSRELDVREFEARRAVGARERSDDWLLDRPVGLLGCVPRCLDLDRGRRGFGVPGQADDDRQPAGSFPLQHLEIVRDLLVGREDRDGSRREPLAPTGVVHVVDFAFDQIDHDLFGLMAVTAEFGARGRHRLGEPFERQPRTMLPAWEQQAGGLVRCVDFPMSDSEAAGFPRARHGSVSPSPEATPPNIVRGSERIYRADSNWPFSGC